VRAFLAILVLELEDMVVPHMSFATVGSYEAVGNLSRKC
jgi:hypothetical protein